jgi:hypothetical protein
VSAKKKTPKSNTIELLKQKVRRQSAAHDQLITPANANVDDGKNANVNTNENAGKNVGENAGENVSVNVDANDNKNVIVDVDTSGDNNVGVDLQQAKQQVLERKKARRRKVRFDEKYKKMTFYILKELAELIDEEAEGEKGEKTRIINDALKMYFGLK